jgi:hypothetical protein
LGEDVREEAAAARAVLQQQQAHAKQKKEERVSALKTIGRAGVQALERVWDGADEAAKGLVDELGKQTTETVHHKYGVSAANPP